MYNYQSQKLYNLIYCYLIHSLHSYFYNWFNLWPFYSSPWFKILPPCCILIPQCWVWTQCLSHAQQTLCHWTRSTQASSTPLSLMVISLWFLLIWGPSSLYPLWHSCTWEIQASPHILWIFCLLMMRFLTSWDELCTFGKKAVLFSCCLKCFVLMMSHEGSMKYQFLIFGDINFDGLCWYLSGFSTVSYNISLGKKWIIDGSTL